MEQHNQEIGTRRDLVLYRLETARNDLKSARALFSIEDYKGANNRAYYSIFHAINATIIKIKALSLHIVTGSIYISTNFRTTRRTVWIISNYTPNTTHRRLASGYRKTGQSL